MEEKKEIKRSPRPFAMQVNIDLINGGEFIHEEEHNYITVNDQKLFRINLIAATVRKEQVGTITNMLLDDGSGKIVVRSFEENKKIDELKVGDVTLVIGKVRVYNQERYISPEICKKVNPLWLKVRAEKFKKIEPEKQIINQIETKININERLEPEKTLQIKQEVKKEIIENKINEISEDIQLPFDRILKLIEELDEGEGVMIEKIIEQSPLDDTNNIIEKMLERGDIFQNKPGKVKLL